MCPQHDETEEDSAEMTSIMSAEERSLLQEAARGGAQGRDTAKPPRSEAEPVVIPKAAALPGASAATSKASSESKTPTIPPAGKAPADPAAAASKEGSTARGGVPLAEVVPFVLLIVASLYAMSH